MPTRPAYVLKQRQSLPLAAKIVLSQRRIKDWYEHWQGQVFVAYSGGRDSTVLLALVRELYPKVPAVFWSTGLQWPEVVEHVKATSNVEMIRPTRTFRTVIETFGYPVISKEVAQKVYEARNTKSDKLRGIRLGKGPRSLPKRWRFLLDAPFPISDYCCHVMKKHPSYKYEKRTGRKAFVGTRAAESNWRKMLYAKTGCNAFDAAHPVSRPISVWTSEDIDEFVSERGLTLPSLYSRGYDRTGCMFCMFGVHMEKEPNRFQRMKKTHPKRWKFCMDKLGLRQVLHYIKVPCK